MDQFIIIAASIFMLVQVFVDAGQTAWPNGRRNSGRRNNGRRNNRGNNGRRNNRGNNGRRNNRGNNGRRNNRGNNGRRNNRGNNGRRNNRGNNGRRNNGRRNNRGNNGRRNNGRRNNGRNGRNGGLGGSGFGHRQSINIHGSNNAASNIIRSCRNTRDITEKIRCDFNIHDLNHDGVIPYDEFVLATPYINQFDKAELFGIFDSTDGDGLITPKEFRIGAQILTNMNLMDQCNFQAIADGPCFY